MVKKYGYFVLSAYFLALPLFIIMFLTVRYDVSDDIIASIGLLLVSTLAATIINSSKHDEAGQVFQLKSDYKIFRFIKYDIETWQNLPIVFVLLAFHYILSFIILVLVLSFRSIEWMPAITTMGVFLIFNFVFILVELIIDKFRR